VGKLASKLYPSGVQAVYSYDQVNRLTNLSVSKTEVLVSYAYALDPTGRRLSVAENGGRPASYGYDAVYRLTGEASGGDA
jgi:hypothetical protein